MLSPRYLDGLSDEITEIYSQLETDILQDMARRLARVGKITDATKWQAQMLAEAGGLKKNIGRILAKYDKAIARQIEATFTNALETSARNDSRIFKDMAGRTVSAPNAQAMLSTIQKCHSDLSRLTLTTAATTQTQFVQQANRVYMQTQSGAFDYDTAMKDAADELAKRGITAVQYENGKPVARSIESAVRMNILTSINQTAANQTLNNAEELGVERFEVTAHTGARPEHEEWQGKIYTKEELYSVCGLGDVAGLCGINCRHSFYPYFEGMEKHYTQDDLDGMASEKVTYTDKDGEAHEMTRYEGEQRLRHMERNIRRYKREALTQEAAGVDNTKARRKLGEWQEKARDFTRQTGIARDYAREYVGTKGKQPRGSNAPVAKEDSSNTPGTPFFTTKDISHRASEIYKSEKLPLPEKQNAVMNWLNAEDTKTKGIEKSVFLDRKGNIISIGEGELGRVGFTNSGNETKQLNKAKELSVTMFHNHFRNSTFSADDIDLFLKQSSLGSIYAICNNRTYFKLTKTHNFDNSILQSDIVAEYNELVDKLKNRETVIQEFCKKYDLIYQKGVFK